MQTTYYMITNCLTGKIGGVKLLLKLANDLLLFMERKNVTALIALDLSATLDTVDHRILLTTLNRKVALMEWH